MASTYYVKRGDTSPSPQTPLDDGNGDPLDVPTGTTVVFKMRAPDDDAALLVDAAGQFVVVGSHKEALYAWAPQNTDIPAGIYLIEWHVTWGDDGRTTTFPNDGYDKLVVTDTLD